MEASGTKKETGEKQVKLKGMHSSILGLEKMLIFYSISTAHDHCET